jgi:hypothetical protein
MRASPIMNASRGAILDAAAELVADTLSAQQLALAEPVDARFRDAASGTTGVEISVRLRDRTRAGVARALLLDRFGSSPDVFLVR